MRWEGVLAPLVVAFAASKPTASGWVHGEVAPAGYVTGAAGSLSEVESPGVGSTCIDPAQSSTCQRRGPRDTSPRVWSPTPDNVAVQPAGLARVLSWTMREVAPSLRAHDASVRSAQSLEYGALTRRCQRLVVPLVGVKLFRHTPQMMGPKAHQPLATRIARRRLRLSAHVAVTYLDISSTGAADAESGPGAGVRT